MSFEEERYAGLISLSDELARATSAPMVCSALATLAPRVVGGYDAVIFARKPLGGGEQSRFAPVARRADQLPVRAFDADWPISRPALVNRSTAHEPNAPYRVLWDALGELEPGSLAHVPLGPSSLLVVLFRSEDRLLSRDDWTVLASIAEQAAAANERLEALARVRELSLCDADTGLGNRRLIDLVLQHRFAGAVRGEPLSMVALRVSQTEPEAVTDAGCETIVRRIAQLLRSEQRGSDVTAHLGGGLFVVVLHGAPQAGADAFLRRIRQELSESDVASAVITHGPLFTAPGELLAAVLDRVGASPAGRGAADGAVDTCLVTPAA